MGVELAAYIRRVLSLHRYRILIPFSAFCIAFLSRFKQIFVGSLLQEVLRSGDHNPYNEILNSHSQSV